MHPLLLLLLLPALTLATPPQQKPYKGCKPSPTTTITIPTSTPTPAANSPFALMSVRSGTNLQYRTISANGQAFWIGKDTATYCPADVPDLDCSGFTANITAIGTATPGKASRAYMDVDVPGSQQLYVTKEGALGFTQAHSASIPSGAYTTGFVHDLPAHGEYQGYLDFTAGGATGFVACETKRGSDLYQVFVDVEGADVANCTGFEMFALPYGGAPAWEYT